MAATRHEMGLVDSDQHTHVAVPKLNGSVAMCGAGRIVHRVPGWFDPSDEAACAACVQRLAGAA